METLCIMLLFGVVAGNHYRGGIFTMSPLHMENKTMEISLQVSYARRHLYTAGCDAQKVSHGRLVGSHPKSQGIFCTEGCPTKELVTLIRYVCTDFSLNEGWEYGERKVIHAFPNSTKITLSAKGCCWIIPFQKGAWDLFIKMDLSVRPDILRINSSPQARFFPITRIQAGCNNSISILPYDPDGDLIRCRWGNATTKECAGVCDGFPGAVLDEATCTLTHNTPSTDSGYKAVAIMMEDFSQHDKNFERAYSTVALNFLVFVYKSDLECLEAKPEFLPPTPPDISCIGIPPGETYQGHIVVDSKSSSAKITEVRTVVPAGVIKSNLIHGGEQLSYVNITWTPKERDYYENNNNVESMCFSAVSSNGQQTKERCIQLMAGTHPPRHLQFNNLMVGPISPEFTIFFDQSVTRSDLPAKVKFISSSTKSEVYSIIVNDENGQGLIGFLGNNTVKVRTLFQFQEREMYSMILDEGFAKGVTGCGARSLASDSSSFNVQDVTPPVITFVKNPKRSNDHIVIEWSFNEQVSDVDCIMYSLSPKERVLDSNSCQTGIWQRSGLEEGTYRLEIKASDLYGNEETSRHTWYADLTPPVAHLLPPFKGNTTNQEKPVFRLECPNGDSCKFHCRYGNSASQLDVHPCDTGTFITPVFNKVSFLFFSAEDDVGNKGKEQTFVWVSDLIPPTLILSNDEIVAGCDGNLSFIMPPIVVDDMDKAPLLNYTDQGDRGGCNINRTWKAIDAAGNSQTVLQRIKLSFNPKLNYVRTIQIPCDKEQEIVIPKVTANTDNFCRRKVMIRFTDSSSRVMCPGQVNRTWFYKDSCDPNAEEKMAMQNIIFYETCPQFACGRHHSPSHGICIDGKCICNKPWYGQDCGTYIEVPVIIKPQRPRVFIEGSHYSEVLTLSSGTPPVAWQLISGRESMTIRDGKIEWECNEVGDFKIEVRAENAVGSSNVSWNLTINPAYRTYLNALQRKIFVKSKPVNLTGYVEYEPGNLLQNNAMRVPVVILVRVADTTRNYEIRAEQDNTFKMTFEPLPTEFGLYEAVSKHPGARPASPAIGWKVLDMRFKDQIIDISEKSALGVDLKVPNVTSLVNAGPEDLTNIQVHSVAGVSQGVELTILFDDNPILPHLMKDTAVWIGIHIKAPGPFDWTRAYFEVKSSEGVAALLIMNVKVAALVPKLTTLPTIIKEEVLQGKQKVIQVNITNIGEADARDVTVQVPNVALISVISYGKSSYATERQNLVPKDSILLVLRISPRKDSKLGLFEGILPISSDKAWINLPVEILVISNSSATVTFRVEDEYSYFASDKPLVDGARIRIYNRNRGISLTNLTKEGFATFEDIPEETYEVFVHAPRHQGVRNVYAIKGGSNSYTIFLKRTAVTYKWTVIPTNVEDSYQIKVEADFETRVPIPVVTISPISVDLEPFELGLKNSIQFNVTNHGLIRAERTRLNLPNNHPILEFDVIAQPEKLDALSSVLIPVKVTRKEPGRRRRATTCALHASFRFGYECGDWILRDININLNWNAPCGGRIRGRGGRGRIGYFGYHSIRVTSSNLFCDPCFQSFVECAWNQVPFSSTITCLFKSAPGNINDHTYHINDLLKTASECALGDVKAVIEGLLEKEIDKVIPEDTKIARYRKQLKTADKVLKRYLSLLDCFLNIAEKCGIWDYLREKTGRSKRDVKQTLIRDYTKAVEPFIVLVRFKQEVYGDNIWLIENNWDWFERHFLPLISDNSDIGSGISQEELNKLANSDLPYLVDINDINKFASRWNNTYFAWQSGKLEPDESSPDQMSYAKIKHYQAEIVRLNQLAVDAGYQNFVEQYNDKNAEISKIDMNEKEEEGICAVVRIKIEQEIALTREGFIAKLEIENGENSVLRDINVTIMIQNADTGEEANVLFSIGTATVGGDMMGDRSLQPRGLGELEWLMIPYSTAAPSDETYYDVGGTLQYKIEGSNINAPLLPGRIRVKPDPRLHVFYFWEKFVISDDPFTERIEPAIPFLLAVAVRNSGNGSAFNMRITSSQPEIIDNEKGLYINFKMIGATIGNTNTTPSLSVNFGDILPGETVIAKWWMVASLKGMFQNYSASFENNNPLGDPRLSLLDKLIVKELIHEVLIVGLDTEEDELGDFLINGRTDIDVIPDAVFSSLTMNNFSVNFQEPQEVKLSKDKYQNLKVFLNSTSTISGFVYYRHELPIAESEQVLQNSAFMTKKVDTMEETLPRINAWVSTMRGEKKSEYLILHVFDLIKSNEIGKEIMYEIVFGPDVHDGLVTLRATQEPLMTADIQPVQETTTLAFKRDTDGTVGGNTPEITADPPIVVIPGPHVHWLFYLLVGVFFGSVLIFGIVESIIHICCHTERN